MSTAIDARGLSCPQPVLLTLDEIKKGSDAEIVVWVDADTSKENENLHREAVANHRERFRRRMPG